MDYFPHDTHAMQDDKLMALRMDGGLEAVAIYWAVLEKIYADESPFELSETNVGARSVSYILGVGFDDLTRHVFHMCELGLFYQDADNPNLVMSIRADEHINALEKKREIARQNGKSGGRKSAAKPKSKPKKTNVGSSTKPTSVPSSPQIKPIGFHKENQIGIAPVGAAAAKAAPPVACPECDANMERTSSTQGSKRIWRCPLCGTEKAVEEVA